MQEAREADAYTINEVGIPSAVLMERAALAVANELQTNEAFDLSKTLVVAATGNNGGDGLAVARLLFVQGLDVTVLLLGNEAHATVETQRQLKICRHYRIPIVTTIADFAAFTTIVDGIFGVGLARPVEGAFAETIQAMNASPANIMAIDVPSGLQADTGEILGTAIQAATTVTMAARKLGFTAKSEPNTGHVIVADIGVYQPH
ncbi:NAD(P)H-hydrate epimerase [Secundilactobacillus oryzae]|uniref:NAD(P)H-hydrate epimerase n=1 Tax=Secundilactobacillus oryzae TaxID=1202668 RepID=UPI0006D1DD1C|nr:NAD(P)H-hydrate epimerase [Secundilactobacillus oryzae]